MPVNGYAQQKIKRSELPPRIFSKFITLFPNNAHLKETAWEKQGANYSMSFDKKGQKNSATLDPSGKIIALKANIAIDLLPNDIFCYLEDHYRRYYEDSAIRTIDAKGKEVFEVVIYRQKEDKTTLVFDGEGHFLHIKTK